MYKFCNKCGNITLGNKNLEEKCQVCGNVKIPVPTKYIQENEILTDKELEDRTIMLIEELVKTSPEFDQYLFDHRDEILAKQSAEFNAKMEHGKAILEEGNRTPKCTYCGSTNIRKIGLLNRAISIELWGLGSKKIGKQFHCNHCGADF
jgi:hypothetical protein